MVEPHFIRAYDPNNPADTCYGILSNSDINGDGTVDRDEYMSFVGQLSGGEIEVTNYIDLPFVIKVTFVYLSCLCMNSPENQMMRSECCKGSDAGISFLGAGPGETPTSEEDEYLTTVCSETQGAIDFERDETVTTSPTAVTQQTIRVSFFVILIVASMHGMMMYDSSSFCHQTAFTSAHDLITNAVTLC